MTGALCPTGSAWDDKGVTMPRELLAVAPRTPELREYASAPLGPGQVRVRSELGAAKHGTELMAYRGEAIFNTHRYDPKLRILVPHGQETTGFPRPLGNMIVGRVTEAAADATTLRVGDRVYGHAPLREEHVMAADRFERLPEGLSAEAALCADPADAALAMR